MISAVFLLTSTFAQKPDDPTDLVSKDEVVGAGKAAKSGDVVTVEYTGTLNDGTKFDSTDGKGAFTFILGAGEVIKGWDQGIVGIKEGGKRNLTIPASLGYGDKAAGPIPPNSTLHFEVTLKKIEPPEVKEVITKGDGPAAKIGDYVFVNIKGGVKGGKLIFNSLQDYKSPVKIQLGMNRLPIGFTDALLGMQKGETVHVLIPPELAYKELGLPPADDSQGHKAGSLVPPNSTMEFTFDMVDIKPPVAG